MNILRTVEAARAWSAERRAAGQRVGLVPTMGALHAGHLALVGATRGRADAVALSVFVNPTQFGPGEDFERYPRDLERDAELAATAGVDALFVPAPDDMYPEKEALVTVDVGPLGGVLEGLHRPTHFRGVATVVTKLLGVFCPDVATFGQKDAQQVVVVRRVVREMLLPVEIICVPTVRDADGLALSSRNRYLSVQERRAAPVLRQALSAAEAAVQAGRRQGAEIEAVLRGILDAEPLGRTDYAAVVQAGDLRPATVLQGRILMLVAVRFGATRLLDNACLDVGPGGVSAALP